MQYYCLLQQTEHIITIRLRNVDQYEYDVDDMKQ
jgi:hypothetical protein